MKDNQTEEVVDVQGLEDSFNGFIDDLKKAIGDPEPEDEKTDDLKKAKSDSKDMDYDDDAEDEDEVEEEEEEEDEEEVEKSLEDMVAEDPEAEAAMDVEPFLKSLVNAIDTKLATLQKAVGKRLDGIEVLAKSQARALVGQMELQKAQKETVDKIAKQDVKTSTIRRLQKSRFEGSGDTPAIELNGPVVLEKSLDWLKSNQINLIESGMIETRVNKGLLGKINDTLDRKVEKLLRKEAS